MGGKTEAAECFGYSSMQQQVSFSTNFVTLRPQSTSGNLFFMAVYKEYCGLGPTQNQGTKETSGVASLRPRLPQPVLAQSSHKFTDTKKFFTPRILFLFFYCKVSFLLFHLIYQLYLFVHHFLNHIIFCHLIEFIIFCPINTLN